MCKLSDVVLFSAAIPGQGGTHHLNERWPSYWANLFGSAGYDVLDVVRANIWDDARVEWWYRQNLLVFGTKRVYLGSRVAGTLIEIVGRPRWISYILAASESTVD